MMEMRGGETDRYPRGYKRWLCMSDAIERIRVESRENKRTLNEAEPPTF